MRHVGQPNKSINTTLIKHSSGRLYKPTPLHCLTPLNCAGERLCSSYCLEPEQRLYIRRATTATLILRRRRESNAKGVVDVAVAIVIIDIEEASVIAIVAAPAEPKIG